MLRKRTNAKCPYGHPLWASSFKFSNGLTFKDLPRPKFSIGQPVFWQYLCDDTRDSERFGKLIRYSGWVTGVNYDNREIGEPCWAYQVHWRFLDGIDTTSRSIKTTEIIAESDLLHVSV